MIRKISAETLVLIIIMVMGMLMLIDWVRINTPSTYEPPPVMYGEMRARE